MSVGQDVVARSPRRRPFLLGGDPPGAAGAGGSLTDRLNRLLEARQMREEAAAVGEVMTRLDGTHPGAAQTLPSPAHATQQAVETISGAFNGVLGAVQNHANSLQAEVTAAKQQAGDAYAAGESAASEIAGVALEAIRESNKGALDAVTAMGSQALAMAREVQSIIVGVKDAQIAALTEVVGSQRQQIQDLRQGATTATIASNDPMRGLATEALQMAFGRVKEELGKTPHQRLQEAQAIVGATAPPQLTIEQQWQQEQVLAARSKRQQAERHADEAHDIDMDQRRELTDGLKQVPGFIEKWVPRLVGGAPATGTHNGIPDSWTGGGG